MDREKSDSAKPKQQMSFKGFVREPNISCVELLDLGNQQLQGKAIHDTGRRRWSLGQKVSAQKLVARLMLAASTVFFSKRAKLFLPFRRLFLCLLDAS